MIRVVLLLAFIGVCESFGACSNGWREYRGNCFSFNPEELSWFEAASLCGIYDSYLAVVDNADTNQFLVSQIQEFRFRSAWVGGSSRYHRDSWEWVPSEVPFGEYQNWEFNGPSNRPDRHCLEIKGGYGNKWNDQECDEEGPSICQKPVRQPGRT